MKTYDEKKICFIICTNNEQYLEECLLYLSLLEVPAGYETEFLTIEGAKSMTAGYNEGMYESNAKYKIYLHQDTFVTERKLLYKLLDVFQSDTEIGMVGTIGSEILSKDGVMWHGDRCGDFYRLDEMKKDRESRIEKIKAGNREVEVVDGLFMATQYDLPWREDILDGWDFYDVSQCLEFRRAGYKVVIPAQNPAWVIHDCSAPGFWHYNKYRGIILKEYPEIWKDKNYLRVYFMNSKEIGLLGIPYSLQKMGHKIVLSGREVSINTSDSRAVEYVEEKLEEGHYDLVMSYDFLTTVASACDNCKVKYWAWVYDNPLLDLYVKEALLPSVYVSVFDRKQYERIQALGLQHVFYMPLATEVDYFGLVNITKSDERKYKADVAFVGRLYDKRGYEELFGAEQERLQKEADEIVRSCNCVWDGKNSIFGKASEELIEHIASKEPVESWEIYSIDKRYYAESMKLVRKCNEIERVTILNELAKRHKVVLYSDEGSKEQLQRVKIRPWVDYWKEMPKVFYLSKINLNITSRSIESGIPQRVFDIMAVGGFCLTNYQPELEEYFEIGKDLEVYHNLEELLEKVDYYLKHEEDRVRIAMNGYKKVRAEHNYINRFEKTLEELFE